MRSNEIELYKNRLKLNAVQKNVLVGILLGDATLETQNKGRTYRLKIEHSLAQKTYVEHLYEIFSGPVREGRQGRSGPLLHRV